MLRRRLVILVLLALIVVSVVRVIGFRCLNVRNDKTTLCYSWFRPHVLLVRDGGDRPFYYGILDNQASTYNLPPAREYVDLGGGRLKPVHRKPTGWQVWVGEDPGNLNPR